MWLLCLIATMQSTGDVSLFLLILKPLAAPLYPVGHLLARGRLAGLELAAVAVGSAGGAGLAVAAAEPAGGLRFAVAAAGLFGGADLAVAFGMDLGMSPLAGSQRLD